MNTTPLQKLLQAISDCRPSGDGWKARCPAHDDRRASFFIKETDDGTVLMKCFANCTTDAILAKVGLALRDLFPDQQQAKPAWSKAVPALKSRSKSKTFQSASDAVAELERGLGPRSDRWIYHDAKGGPVGVVVRWNLSDGGKHIRPVARNGKGWIIGGMPTPRPLYELPMLLRSQGRVYVPEGERKVDTLHSLGLVATASAHGGGSAKGTDWTPLTGREVIILPDNDATGMHYAANVAKLLAKVTPSVKVVNLPDLPASGDIVDYVKVRRTAGLDDAAIRAEIETMADNAMLNAPNVPAIDETPVKPIIVCLADVAPQPVEWLWPGRIAIGKVTLIAGDPGLGKSFITLDMAARVSRGAPWPDAPSTSTTAGGVVLLSAEDDVADTIRPRLDAAGADVERIQALQAVCRNNEDDRTAESPFSLETDLPALEAAIRATTGCRLIVIDPITGTWAARTPTRTPRFAA